MKYIILPITLLLSVNLFAETDSFDMSLSGNFGKDFCTFNSQPLYNPSEIEPPPDDEPYYPIVQATGASLTCSDGEYDITLTTDSPKIMSILGKNQTFEVAATTDPDKGIYTPIGQMSPVSHIVNFLDNNMQNYQFNLIIRPTDGDWNNIAEQYSHTVTPIITIEQR